MKDLLEMFTVFKNKNFRNFWCAETVSEIGSRLHSFTIAILIYNITGSALEMAKVLLLYTLPSIILSPIIGVYIDKWNKKKIVVNVGLLKGVLVLFLVFTNNITYIYIIIFALSVCDIFFDPSATVLMTNIVEKHNLLKANSVLSISERTIQIISPIICGALIAIFDTSLIFIIDSISYIISTIIFQFTINYSNNEKQEEISRDKCEDNLKQGFISGFKYIFKDKVISMLSIIGIIVGFVMGANNTLFLIYSKEVLKVNNIELGYISSALCIGLLVGPLLVNCWEKKINKIFFISFGLGLIGVSLLITSNIYSLGIAILLRVIFGIGLSMYTVSNFTLMQEKISESYRGRVLTIFSTIQDSAYTLSLGIGALLSDCIGVKNVLGSSGIMAILGVFLWLIIIKNNNLSKQNFKESIN